MRVLPHLGIRVIGVPENTLPLYLEDDPYSAYRDYLAYYRFNEASGNAVDVTGVRNATQNGTCTAETGKIAGARGCGNTTADFFSSTGFAASQFTGDYTIAGWYYKRALGTTGTVNILSKRDTAGSGPLTIVWTGNVLYAFVNDQIGFQIGAQIAEAIANDTWIFFAFRHTLATKTGKIWVNAGSASGAPYAGAIANEADVMRFGADQGAAGGPVWLDALGIWNSAKSDAWVTEVYNGGAGLPL